MAKYVDYSGIKSFLKKEYKYDFDENNDEETYNNFWLAMTRHIREYNELFDIIDPYRTKKEWDTMVATGIVETYDIRKLWHLMAKSYAEYNGKSRQLSGENFMFQLLSTLWAYDKDEVLSFCNNGVNSKKSRKLIDFLNRCRY